MITISPFTKRITAALLAISLAFSLAACNKDKDTSSSGSSSSSSSSSGTAAPVDAKPVPPDKAMVEKLKEKQAINPDVVGWLRVPNTEIDEEILQGPGPDDGYDVAVNKEFYERRDINKQYDWYGCYFADYECKIENERNDLSNITILYGHSMDDDPDGKKFSKLKRFNEQNFAENNPYIYFTTPEDDMVWQIFSVAYTDIKLPYYKPNLAGNELESMIRHLQDRSLYDYEVEVEPDDKLLILSTCTYKFGATQQEQEGYRYLISARLVRPAEKSDDKKVKLTKNEDVEMPKV